MRLIVIVAIIIILTYFYTVRSENNQREQYHDDLEAKIKANSEVSLEYQVDVNKEEIIVEEEVRVLKDMLDLYGDTYKINVDLLARIMARLQCMSNYYSDIKTGLMNRTDDTAMTLFAEASVYEGKYEGLYSTIKATLSLDKYDFYMILNTEPEIVVNYGPDWYRNYTESSWKASGLNPYDMLKMEKIMACKIINGEANIDCIN